MSEMIGGIAIQPPSFPSQAAQQLAAQIEQWASGRGVWKEISRGKRIMFGANYYADAQYIVEQAGNAGLRSSITEGGAKGWFVTFS